MNGTLIPLAGLYENTSNTSGQTYFVGYLGKAKVLLLKDKNAAEGEPGWTLFIAEKPAKPANGLASRSKPHTSASAKQAAMDAGRPFNDDISDVR